MTIKLYSGGNLIMAQDIDYYREWEGTIWFCSGKVSWTWSGDYLINHGEAKP